MGLAADTMQGVQVSNALQQQRGGWVCLYRWEQIQQCLIRPAAVGEAMVQGIRTTTRTLIESNTTE